MSIVEVAKLAGVSHTTVSRVLNSKPGVSAVAFERVQEAIRQLDYTPPQRRRGPQPKVPGRGDMVGAVALLMFGTDPRPMFSPVSSAVIHSIEQALSDLGISFVLAQVKEVDRLPPAVLEGKVDGLILHGHLPGLEIAQRLRSIPSVWIMSARSKAGYWGDRVAPDNYRIGALAAENLIDQGHASLGYLSVRSDHIGFATRAEGFMETAAAQGVSAQMVEVNMTDSFLPGDVKGEREYIDALIDQFVSLPEMPTGLFVPRGQATVMVYEALRARGVELGSDVVVLSCDPDMALASLNPAPATIDVRPDRVGRVAVEHLLKNLSPSDFETRTLKLIEPRLVSSLDS